LCDGSRNLEAIISCLAEEFDVSHDELAGDVEEFVTNLIERGWLSHE